MTAWFIEPDGHWYDLCVTASSRIGHLESRAGIARGVPRTLTPIVAGNTRVCVQSSDAYHDDMALLGKGRFGRIKTLCRHGPESRFWFHYGGIFLGGEGIIPRHIGWKDFNDHEQNL